MRGSGRRPEGGTWKERRIFVRLSPERYLWKWIVSPLWFQLLPSDPGPPPLITLFSPQPRTNSGFLVTLPSPPGLLSSSNLCVTNSLYEIPCLKTRNEFCFPGWALRDTVHSVHPLNILNTGMISVLICSHFSRSAHPWEGCSLRAGRGLVWRSRTPSPGPAQ